MFNTVFTYRPSGISQPTPDDLFKKDYKFSFNCSLNHQYIVHVEEYEHKLFMLKFHMKSHSNSPHKYQLNTKIEPFKKEMKDGSIRNISKKHHVGRATGIINTCLHIIIIYAEFLLKDKKASFGFIGVSSKEKHNDKTPNNTQRFRIYSALIKRKFSPVKFQHKTYEEFSAYVLLSKKNVDAFPHIDKLFRQALHKNIKRQVPTFP